MQYVRSGKVRIIAKLPEFCVLYTRRSPIALHPCRRQSLCTKYLVQIDVTFSAPADYTGTHINPLCSPDLDRAVAVAGWAAPNLQSLSTCYPL